MRSALHAERTSAMTMLLAAMPANGRPSTAHDVRRGGRLAVPGSHQAGSRHPIGARSSSLRRLRAEAAHPRLGPLLALLTAIVSISCGGVPVTHGYDAGRPNAHSRVDVAVTRLASGLANSPLASTGSADRRPRALRPLPQKTAARSMRLAAWKTA
jgi:hypothetical protein